MGGGRGGQKRGRIQRRHFRQGRENTWKYSNKKTRSDEDATVDDPNANRSPNLSWEPFSTQNPGFEEYYKGQVIVPEEEWDEFMSVLRKPLPAAFRINASGQFFKDIRMQMENEFVKSLDSETNDYETDAIRPLPWYPDKLAWHLNFSRMQLRKNQTLERFHEFLKQENEVGTITRQEAVSMVPPLFLDVRPDHYILDMCAAPGSKTFQLLEIIHQSIKPGSLPDGLVIANDVDVQRCNLLIHQTKRMCSANLIVTNHEAQFFPSLSAKDISREVQGESKKDILQFDRILCDVPCSGDGTLRKAPDIWRKWNAGMGNGLHRLQVEIAMRGVSLLKVGGRMVYSTCSMNPVENEAVVAEILRRSKGTVELLEVSQELPELVRRPGLRTWKVRDKGLWLADYEDVPSSRRGVVLPSMFPSDENCTSKLQCNGLYEKENQNNSYVEDNCSLKLGDHLVTMELDNALKNCEYEVSLVDTSKDVSEIEGNCEVGASHADLNETKARVSRFALERCMRILPHDQNSGAFFIAVLHKISSLNDDVVKGIDQSIKRKYKTQRSTSPGLRNDDQPVARSFIDVAQEGQSVLEAAPNPIDEFLSVETDETGFKSHGLYPCSIDVEAEKVEALDSGEDGSLVARHTSGNLHTLSKWRGVDPVVFFRDESTINSIRSFYGISDLLLLDSHLVTRNNDANHVKRIYYISKSVHDIIELNFKFGQKLKIASLGLKVFERQSSKDTLATCMFRLSSEGLPLLLPYIGKQILCASLADFRHLLQYRTIKFPDFVDGDFREKASSTLMSGCCVIALREEEKKETYQISVDSSAIAIVCWKGKSNLSIMVSELDAKELLDRLEVRFGSQKISATDESNSILEESKDPILDIAETEVSEAGHVRDSE